MRRFFAYMAMLSASFPLYGYSVLTHEAIIDTAWDQSIKPLLLKRYPNATPDDLIKAHAYAYGGAIIQDMGYYPFGSKLFSDILHYVRSGDFIKNEIADSQDLNEYAFALGSLAHYAADNEGHSVAVNPSVADEYPKLREKFGKTVTYAEDPTAHLRVEFGFDVQQVARGNYAPQAYHDYIGFNTSKELLNRAFLDTYGIELKDLFTDLDLALGTYRRAVSSVIPEMTRVAWDLNKKKLMQATPGITKRKFIYNLSKASYRKEWDGKYEKPGTGAAVLAFLFRILPKVGPLKGAKPKPPTPETTQLFQTSFDKTMDLYRRLLAEVAVNQLQLENTNFDTGKPTVPADYPLADNAYAKLAIKLADRNGAQADNKIREDIVEYFQNTELPFATKRDPHQWARTLDAVSKLK